MNKLFTLLFSVWAVTTLSAQYQQIDYKLAELEEKKGIQENLKKLNLEDKTFVLIKEFDDHTERQFIKIQGEKSTFIEVFDDKTTGESSSNVFSGDFIKTEGGYLSFRFNELESQPLPLPLVKSLLATRHKKILYLKDINTGERWIELSAIEN